MKKSSPELACIILAAGQGKRMKSARAKVMHELAGRPLIGWLRETVESLSPAKIVIVIGPGMDDVKAAMAPHPCTVQETPRGTGDAVRAGLSALKDFEGDILILLGDMPLLTVESLAALRAARHHDDRTSLSVLGGDFGDHPPAFGRLIRHPDGTLLRIVEDRDCTDDQRRIGLCNTGAFCVDTAKLRGWVASLKNNNTQKEFYITDIVEMAVAAGDAVRVHTTNDLDEVRGVNDRADLAALEQIAQNRLRGRAMKNGATLTDPASVFLSADTVVGRDVVIEPHVVIGPGVTIADNVTIRAFSHLEGARIGTGASIGPFARLRPGSVIGEDSKIGNFVEIKNATLGEGVKASHLAYIGDADVGAGVNFSCGAITVNYDGVNKHKTVIGDGAMIGSNVNLVAPVTIGDGAYIAAGSTITKDVPADALAVAREKPQIVEGWAAQKRKTVKKA